MHDITEDHTPEAYPDFHSYRELPDNLDDSPSLWIDMTSVQRNAGASFFRCTVISEEYPKDGYPHGFYVEGWLVDPARMSPPHKMAEFSHPMVLEDIEE